MRVNCHQCKAAPLFKLILWRDVSPEIRLHVEIKLLLFLVYSSGVCGAHAD